LCLPPFGDSIVTGQFFSDWPVACIRSGSSGRDGDEPPRDEGHFARCILFCTDGRLKRRVVTSESAKANHAERIEETRPALEIVLKCDSAGSMEAVTNAISEIALPGADIRVIRSGVGAVNKSDVLMAETASGLIAGFQVGAMPGMDRMLRGRHVEVRLYEIIYELISDIRDIAERLMSPAPEERIIGSAKVIALFKSSRKGIIVGCEVREGFLNTGDRFRIISAMGPVYSGIIESLHIGENKTQKATAGQKAGIKIRGFNKAQIGNLVECYRPSSPKKDVAWEPAGTIIKK
jgi:translation initiation factor IF-2